MVKSETEKPSVGAEVRRPPEGVHYVKSSPEPIAIGTAHSIFRVDAAPGAEVILCLEGGGMVGFVVRGEVTTRALHRIPLRALERYALERIRETVVLLEDYPSVSSALPLVAGRPYLEGYEKAATGPKPASTTREHYLAWLAARYLQLCAESGKPTKALAEELHLSAATVRDQLGGARRRGLLLAAGPGRAGGELTTKALALLTRDEEA